MPPQEKSPAPSIDRHVSEHDRWLIASLPEEGQREFSENVHQYIGQLGKDYSVSAPGDTQSTIRDLPISLRADFSELAEAIRKLGEIHE